MAVRALTRIKTQKQENSIQMDFMTGEWLESGNYLGTSTNSQMQQQNLTIRAKMQYNNQ